MAEDIENKEAAKKQPGKIKRGFTWAFKPFVNVKGWMGYSDIASGAEDIKHGAEKIFIPEKAERKESFSEACERLGLDEEAIQQKEQDFLKLATYLFLISMGVFLYAIYLAWSGLFAAFLIAFTVCLLSLGYAFRYHFWFFQIKERKLGCTLQEWFDSNIKGEK